jgi:hypothetical protein
MDVIVGITYAFDDNGAPPRYKYVATSVLRLELERNVDALAQTPSSFGEESYQVTHRPVAIGGELL